MNDPGRGTRAWLFLWPYVVVSGIFFVYPFLDAARLAFYQTSGPTSSIFVGLSNFSDILSDGSFHRAVVNTVIFAIASLVIQLPLSLGLALLLAESRGRMTAFFRLALFSPQLVGSIFVGILFSMLFAPRFGLVNQGVQSLVGHGLETNWLSNPLLIMPALILASLWMFIGFNMIYFLAALQNVDRTLLEAARIDGANRWQIFRHVTLPAIKPVTIFVVVTSTIGSLQLFELPYALLNGSNGPDNAGLTIVGYLYQTGFKAGDLGRGAAVGWLLAVLIFVVGIIQIKLSGAHREDTR